MASSLTWTFSWFLLVLFATLLSCSSTEARDVLHMEKRSLSVDYLESKTETRFKRDVATNDKCKQQEDKFLKELNNGKRIHEEFLFQNETNFNIMLTWAGDGIILVATTSSRQFDSSSSLYRSTDYGKSYTNIGHMLNNQTIRKPNGLQHHKVNEKKVYAVTYSSLFLTEDGGSHFQQINLDFNLDSFLIYNDKSENHILTRSASAKALHMTKDGGRHWTQIATGVDTVYWSTSENDKNFTVYISVKNSLFTSNCVTRCDQVTLYALSSDLLNICAKQQLSISYGSGVIAWTDRQTLYFCTPPTKIEGDVYTLKKASGDYSNWKSLLDGVVSFGVQGNFIYATTLTNADKERKMQISSDGGTTWNEAQLETITHDRFFSILDMSEGLIFMHVDDPGDTGHGTLYTSGQDGLIYSKSLKRHFYPRFSDIADFYKVESMRGVYLASKIQEDRSISTVITFDRGGIWQEVEPPHGAHCTDTKGCHLQIHSIYSQKQGINAELPLSTSSAVGLILVHGHVANALQTSQPDVFVTSDGGYTWRKALSGPHRYHIADSGGLLVAISSEKYPKVVRFSTDEGHCWHSYKFTDEDIELTGLLTEPGSQSMSVSIWGYRSTDMKWKVHVIDFREVIKNKCEETDYKLWLAHSSRWKNIEENNGCLLGLKTSFYRLLTESWCYNGHDHKNKKVTSVCKCTRTDYQCDYGYEIDLLTYDCRRGVTSGREIDICIRGHEEKIISEGYRKIPGDKCNSEDTNAFHPNSKKIDLGKVCHSRIQHMYLQSLPVATANYIVAAIVVVIVVLAVAMSTFFIHKLCLLRRHKVVYRYSLLNQTEEDYESHIESALSTHKPVFEDCSDDETLIGNEGKAPARYLDESDDDMLQ